MWKELYNDRYKMSVDRELLKEFHKDMYTMPVAQLAVEGAS